MPRGGKRPGAGRKPGSVNRVTAAEREAALAGGISPLDYMLGVMRDRRSTRRRRDTMAVAAAPYLHARKTEMKHVGPDGGAVQITRIERVIVDPRDPDR